MSSNSYALGRRCFGALALIVAALVLVPSQAFASTAANTRITNTAKVNYNDAGGNAQAEVAASATVTVQLVPSAPTLTSPANQTISQGSSASLSYTITGTANGSDTYNLSALVTPANMSSSTPTFVPANSISIGGTTLAAALSGGSSITVPYDWDVTGAAKVNGIGAGSTIVLAGAEYSVTGVTKDQANNIATITVSGTIAGSAPAGSVVPERKTFTLSVPSGNVTTVGATSGTQTVSTTATSATSGGATATQGTATVVTVNRPLLTVTKSVSVDNGGTFAATGNATPGTTLVYRIVAKNDGTTDASAITFKDVIPNYLSYVAGGAKYATSAATAYSGATPLTEGSAEYSYTAATTTVLYAPASPTSTVAPNAVLILFYQAKIN